MKHFFLFLSLFAVSAMMFAQTIVSTTPSNRNVLIEEYTGIHCGYCPNGHSYGNQVLTAHPNNAWVINIHQGGYAVPSAGEPDYRTAYGDALAGQTGLGGYPAGTVNRHVFSGGVTDVDYTTWPTVANNVLAMASPVNVAIDVDLDYATRQLTVLVEVYYTSNSATSTNKLNLAILQNWIKGPQSNYGNYNSAYITTDGQYYHMHMLRELLTGQWGITIPTTTTGTFWDSTFTYTVPATLGNGNIPVELPNLEIVAFVTEGNQEILNAHGAHVPPAPIDAAVSGISGMPTVICATSFTPTVTIMNKGVNTLTSLDIEYSLDGGATQTYNWTGSLATDATADVNLTSMTITSNGAHTFEAATTNPNAATDYNTVNDSYSSSFSSFVTSGSAPVVEGFTSTTFPPSNMAADDSGDDGKNWTRGTAGHTAAGSAFINWYNISSGETDDLIIEPLDLSGMTNMALTFYVAYRQYSTSYSDKLQVDVSTNCGTTWTNEWQKSGSSLSTGAVVTSNWTSPTAGEWRQEVVDLGDYDGMSDVMVRFRATSAYGNNCFVDDINLAVGASINDLSLTEISIYPNPATDQVSLSLNSVVDGNAIITVINSLGEQVLATSSYVNHGDNTLSLNTSELSTGVYVARIQMGSNTVNATFVISR